MFEKLKAKRLLKFSQDSKVLEELSKIYEVVTKEDKNKLKKLLEKKRIERDNKYYDTSKLFVGTVGKYYPNFLLSDREYDVQSFTGLRKAILRKVSRPKIYKKEWELENCKYFKNIIDGEIYPLVDRYIGYAKIGVDSIMVPLSDIIDLNKYH